MKQQHMTLIVLMLATAAVLTITSIVLLLVPLTRYRLRESELIELIGKIKGAEREAALRELGAMRSVRAIPYIIRISGVRENDGGRAALVAIGEPVIPFLGQVLRGEIAGAALVAIRTAKDMGPTAAPLLPELLKWYPLEPEAVAAAVRAIGDPASMKAVEVLAPKAKPKAKLSPKLPRQKQAEARQ